MPVDSSQPTTAEIRRFLVEFFSDDELATLCFDYFRDVYDDFASSMTKGQKIQLLIERCERRGILSNLLAAIQGARPELYKERFPQIAVQPQPQRQERDPRQVFISHAHQDADFAHRLAADLGKHGWRVWIAPDSIRPGEKWVQAINRGLDECGVFVLVLTPAAVQSRWVQDETNVAIELEHEGRLRLIPLELNRCDIPPLWRALQRTPFQGRHEDGVRALLAALEGRAQVPSLAKVPEPSQGSGETPRPRSAPVSIPRDADIPDITWADIPAGTLMMGSRKGETFKTPGGIQTPDDDECWPDGKPRAIPIKAFKLSAYPITVTQFRPFVQDPAGWVNSQWWTEAGWHDCGDAKAPEFWDNPQWCIDDHPVVGVSWYAAVAHCRWLTARLRALVRLPTEAEWEWAARGPEGRRWPWGNEWRDGACNSREACLLSTSAVGQFPAGVNWTGSVYDLAGNVWEWCSTRCQIYDDHYSALEGTDEWTEAYLAGDASGAVRGGFFHNDARDVRGAFRIWLFPSYRDACGGFRCAQSVWL